MIKCTHLSANGKDTFGTSLPEIKQAKNINAVQMIANVYALGLDFIQNEKNAFM